jgi:hypothetical protein
MPADDSDIAHIKRIRRNRFGPTPEEKIQMLQDALAKAVHLIENSDKSGSALTTFLALNAQVAYFRQTLRDTGARDFWWYCDSHIPT